MKNTDRELSRVIAASSDIDNPDLVEVFEHWQSKCGDEPMPAPQDIDLLDLPKVLKNLYLFDVVNGGEDHRCVYNGNFFDSGAQALRVGDTVQSMPDSSFRTRTLNILTLTIEHARPILFGPSPSVYEGRSHHSIEVLCLPLASKGSKSVERTLSVFQSSAR